VFEKNPSVPVRRLSLSLGYSMDPVEIEIQGPRVGCKRAKRSNTLIRSEEKIDSVGTLRLLLQSRARVYDSIASEGQLLEASKLKKRGYWLKSKDERIWSIAPFAGENPRF
jgi:hypothetical protein